MSLKESHARIQWQGEYSVAHFCLIGVGMDENPDSELVIGPKAVFRSHTVVYYGNRIGAQFMTGHHVLIRELNVIGDDVSIGSHSTIEHHVTIGSRVRIHSGVFIPEYSVLENDCWIGPHVVFTNAKYPRSKDVKAMLTGPHIGKGAKIGANATLLPGVKIGQGALVGAGAVVVKDVPDFGVVAGNPAKTINHLSKLPYEASYE